jgi:hypothetical protein
MPIVTVGIGDGGNELGMGSFPWRVLCRAIARGPAGRIACRIPADFTLLAGVSNWGGYALALAVCALRDRWDLAKPWDEASQVRLIETLVEEAGSVDGVTRRPEPTVDGVPPAEYLGVLSDLRGALGRAAGS